MATLKETAMAYEPPKTLNIAELEKIPVDADITQESHKDDKGKEFTYFVATIEGKKYRVPSSCLAGIKGILQKLPNTKFVSVLKQGTGMNTTYQVIPIQ